MNRRYDQMFICEKTAFKLSFLHSTFVLGSLFLDTIGLVRYGDEFYYKMSLSGLKTWLPLEDDPKKVLLSDNTEQPQTESREMSCR